MADPDEQVVRFSVKELFLDLKGDLKRIEALVEHTAKESDLLALAQRVTTLETDKASTAAVDRFKKWQYGVLAAVAGDLLFNVGKITGLIK